MRWPQLIQRGIAIGFPEGVHLAFDANNGALAAIWTGDFVSARWESQGAGDFNPRGRPVRLARDLAFLPELEGGWPLRPRPTKEAPVNADPTYPRQHGYRFLGYSFDAADAPSNHGPERGLPDPSVRRGTFDADSTSGGT